MRACTAVSLATFFMSASTAIAADPAENRLVGRQYRSAIMTPVPGGLAAGGILIGAGRTQHGAMAAAPTTLLSRDGPTGTLDLPAGLTAEALGVVVKRLSDELANLGAELDAEANSTVSQVSTQLNQNLQDLDKLVQNDVKKPLDQFGSDIRQAAEKLYTATVRIDDLLSRERDCLFANVSLLISGIKAASADLKSGIPFVDAGDPFVYGFQFDGHETPLIVPEEGGRFTVSGYALWSGDTPPDVSLLNEDNSSLVLALPVQRSGSNDAFSAAVAQDFVTQHSGTCFQLQVKAYKPHSFLWGLIHWNTVTELRIPFCVPKTVNASLSVEANVAFVTSSLVEASPAEVSREYRSDNSSCEHGTSYSETKVWPEVDSVSGHITDVRTSDGQFQRNGYSNLAKGFTSSSVTISAYVDSATCVCVPFAGCHLDHSTIFDQIARPVVYASTYQDVSRTSENGAKLSLPETQICSDIDATALPGVPDDHKTFWIKVREHVGSAPPVTVFQSPRTAVGANGGQITTAQAGALTISSTFNPAIINGKMQVCTVVSAAKQCGF